MSCSYFSTEKNYYVRESVEQDAYTLIQFNNYLLSVFFVKGNGSLLGFKDEKTTS